MLAKKKKHRLNILGNVPGNCQNLKEHKLALRDPLAMNSKHIVNGF